MSGVFYCAVLGSNESWECQTHRKTISFIVYFVLIQKCSNVTFQEVHLFHFFKESVEELDAISQLQSAGAD